MKTIRFFRIMILVAIMFVNANCKKENPFANATSGVVVPPPTINTSPKANAGSDKQVILPTNTCLLAGSAYDKENNIQMAQWDKISGPASFLIENQTSISTQVKNLQLGVYQFELTVKDSYGLMSKDTVAVTVGQISTTPNETIFKNFIWGTEGLYGTLLWGSVIIIPNIYQYMPAGSVFRTFIKKGNSTNWEELFFGEHSWYSLDLINGKLIIWSNYDETDVADIKLVY